MDKLIITDSMRNGIKGTKIVHGEKSEEYKKLVEEANERLRQSQAEQSKVVAKAQSYYAR